MGSSLVLAVVLAPLGTNQVLLVLDIEVTLPGVHLVEQTRILENIVKMGHLFKCENKCANFNWASF